MRPETVTLFREQILSITASVKALEHALQAEALATNDRQYLARCFDLLHMELAAVDSCVAATSTGHRD